MGDIPKDLKYTKDHEWAKVDGKLATVGVTAFATEQLGDIVYVELPKVGDLVKAGATCGVVESTKAVSDLFSPLTGKVAEVNTPVVDAPELINQSPYDKGWLVKVEMGSPGEVGALMDAARYEAHVKASAH